MRRLLGILSGMNAGGAETFLMKIYRNIDRSKYQMDFCINFPQKCFYEDEILSLGGRIYRIPSKSENIKEFKKQLFELVKTENYKYVLRITSNAMGFLDLKIAKKAGARVCCARSSNSSDGQGWKTKLAHIFGRTLYGRYVDVAFAPSDLAAVYTFGKRSYQNGKVSILNNAVDLNVFRYDISAREDIRNAFDIKKHTKVIGHIGRFSEQKNHNFLLDIFKNIKEIDNNTVLLLVGEGPLKGQLEEKAKNLGITDNVIFAGVRSDIPALLSAMDVFVFPSLYEGMPNTVIEAQATGLPCLIADTITKSAKITPVIEYLPLSASADIWAKSALEKTNSERMDTHRIFREKGYDIRSAAQRFIQIIFKA